MNPQPAELECYQTAILMRGFKHAAAQRDKAESIVLRLRLSDGSEGWGETLPRPYVTGESPETLLADLRELYWPEMKRRSAMPDLLAGPGGGRTTSAARAGLEIAWLDAAARSAGASLGGKISDDIRVSGVLGSQSSLRTATQITLMRIYGLRHFKLKLGLGEQADEANLRCVCDLLPRSLRRGQASLRVDVNGGWQAQDVPHRVAELKKLGVCAVEQPVFCGVAELADLAGRCELPLIADESVRTIDEAAAALRLGGGRVWPNIRISKNGGIEPSAAIAVMAAEAGVPFVIGCMVGETGILSAAQRVLLARCPKPAYAEGNYGRFLLGDDLTSPSPRFHYGGKLAALPGPGLGVQILPAKLARYGRLVATLE